MTDNDRDAWLSGTPTGIWSLGSLIAGEPVEETQFVRLCEFADVRRDCADFRVVWLLFALARGHGLSDATRDRIRTTLLGFKYWMDEAGEDSMCFWSENHQVLFATCEYLAGQAFPDETFTNPGPGGVLLMGRDRMARASARLRQWYGDRFAFGFSEWLSNVYYEEDIAALALMIDLGEDEDLVRQATMTLDLLLLDMALHRVDGLFAATSGRLYEAQKKDPRTANVVRILDHAFEGAVGYDPDRLSALFVVGSRYETPEVLRRIAASGDAWTMRQSHGFDLAEVRARVGGGVVRTGLVYWLMEAFTNPESVRASVRLFRAWALHTNAFLRPMRYLSRVPGPLLGPLVRLVNPVTQGVALERADVTAWRSAAGLLSSAQHYRPGGFGGQQHIWAATLAGGVSVFANHPGAPSFASPAGAVVQASWVGNGINPDVAQDGNVVLALHDLRVRRGLLEGPRLRFTHLYWPADRFDEVRGGDHVDGGSWLVGRSGSGCVGVVSARRLRAGGADELIQDGAVTAWCVRVVDSSDIEAVAAEVRAWRMGLDEGRPAVVTVTIPGASGGHYRLSWRGGMTRNGVAATSDHPRLSSPFGVVERFPTRIRVEADGHSLDLDWLSRQRVVDGPGAGWSSAFRTAVALADDVVRRVRPVGLGWDWGPALLASSLLGMDERLGQDRYREWVTQWAGERVRRRPEIRSSDTLAGCLVTHELWRLGDDRFEEVTRRGPESAREAVQDGLPNHLGTSPWSLVYPDSVWVDSLMMLGVFAARFGAREGDDELLRAAAALPVRFAERLQDPATGLWHHSAWRRSGRAFPSSFWGRGNGWVVASLSMIAAEVPAGPERDRIVEVLARTSEPLLGLQRPDGTWPTVLGRRGRVRGAGYRELSATALIAGGWLQAVASGWLPEAYRSPAERALTAVAAAVTCRDGDLVLPEVSGPTIPLTGRLGYLLTPRGDHTWGVAAFLRAAAASS